MSSLFTDKNQNIANSKREIEKITKFSEYKIKKNLNMESIDLPNKQLLELLNFKLFLKYWNYYKKNLL